ncbi:MAG: helix-hairpin-helix domain-containing protein [Deltaproteobacteria bacterium]|nr:helix-hairpin-helix domain-containing protein [Deltaproteobacteria bacterium]
MDVKIKVCVKDAVWVKKTLAVTVFIFIFLPIFCSIQTARGQEWTELVVRLLPDSSFAVIEFVKNGKKIRHCPYLDANGKLDAEQLIYVLGTLSEEQWIDPKNRKVADKILQKQYNRYLKKVLQKGSPEPVNINRAKLTEFVTLPHVGPALAVKIVEYRKKHHRFDTIEEIQMVNGIGQGMFNAIRHYIKIF